MPSYKFSNPMDMEFAADGDLYMLEYGSGWFSANDDARLIRIEYNGGNRKPQLQVAANKLGGSAPLDLGLSAKGTTDADGDALTYAWKVTSKNGFTKLISTPDAALTLSKVGVYQATLIVNDGKGGVASQSMDITVGNEPPVLSLEIPGGNRSFYEVGKPFAYKVKVKDKEDGTLGMSGAASGISAEQVAVTIDYLAEGYDQVAIAQGHRSADAGALFASGKKLIEASDCMACHSTTKKSIGPAYADVSKKYKGDASALERLTKKVIGGGGGVWGEIAMSAHPQLSATDAADMVKYILSVSSEAPATSSLPVAGVYTAKLPEGDKGKGVFIVRASYEDKGANGLPSLRSEQVLVLRNAKMDAHAFDTYDNINKMSFGGNNLAIPSKSGSFAEIKKVDLTGIKELRILATAPKPQLNAKGGKVELRLDSPTGTLLGESKFLEPSDKMDFTPSQLTLPLKLPVPFDNKPHDIYLVFVNPAEASGSLMVVMGAEIVLTSNGK